MTQTSNAKPARDGKPDPSLLFETLGAYQRTEALVAAIELDVFSHLADEGSTAEELSKKCGCDLRGIRILADYLCIMGFLEKSNGKYSLTPSSRLFLVRSSPAYLGGVTGFLQSDTLVSSFKNLAATVRTGSTLLPGDGTVSYENPVWIKFAEAMGAMMRIPGKVLAEHIDRPLNAPLKVLDVAAGHGEFGFAVARRYAHSKIYALDWAPVLKFTAEQAKKQQLEKQMEYLAGDAFEVKLPELLDVVLIPNFLHHFDAETCTRFLKRLAPALAPGADIYILEFIPNEDRISPAGSAGFALTMLCTTAKGDAYTFAEYAEMLKAAGFSDCRMEKLEAGVERLIRARVAA